VTQLDSSCDDNSLFEHLNRRLNFFNNGVSPNGCSAATCVPWNNGTSNDRGANTAAEFERQRTKIINAITTISPDVLGLTEVSTACHALGVDCPAVLDLQRHQHRV
jgi:hypothetical protein